MTTTPAPAQWNAPYARQLAQAYLGKTGNRWLHVRAVGALAEQIERSGKVSTGFAAAAWLHDIGYATEIADTGFHPVDGARWLLSQGAPRLVVGLVAHHTGALFEAAERGLETELSGLPRPPARDLAALTLIDLSVGPTGSRVTPPERIREILTRYEPDSPVHRAISAARPWLLRSCDSARRGLGLPPSWPRREPQTQVGSRSTR